MANLMKNNKALNLLYLKKKKFHIPTLEIFKCSDFLKNEKKTIDIIQKKFRNLVAIRSSANDEDGSKVSNAGKYTSIINSEVKDANSLKKHISKVINSYGKNKRKNIFFVQSMVKNIKLSGVVLTTDLNTYSPYIVINYHQGPNPTVVTSGGKKTHTLKYFPNKKYKINSQFQKLVHEILKLKRIYNCELDVEFCIDKNNKVFILQARKLNLPIKRKDYKSTLTHANFERYLSNLEKKILKLKKKQNTEFGQTTYFGVMPDWNPAEIIGKKPKPLSLSLYRELITDHVWSENRYNYGFQDISQFHLMTTFYNTPFIDVKVDFNSWIPRDLTKQTKVKLINFYLNKFGKNKFLHDKIEKEIIYSCYSVNLEKKIKFDLKKKFSQKEILKIIFCLKKINNLSIEEKNKDLNKIKNLIDKQKKIEGSNMYFFDKIYWHIENCKKFGTLPFAGLARCGFIAIEIIDSFVKNKIFTNDDKNKFLQSVKTISSELSEDFNTLNKSKFLSKYGHLRPNSYEISSPNYNSAYNKLFKKRKVTSPKKNKFYFSEIQKKQIIRFIRKFNKKITFTKFIDFLKESIRDREYSKFIFMKSIDLVFNNLKSFAKKHKIETNSLSYLKINDITDFYYNLNSSTAASQIKEMIKKNKIEYLNNYYIDLPDVILSPKDLYIVKIPEDHPNYITDKTCEGDLLKLNLGRNIDLSNKVICIENADPGYDFIFSHKIKGLITKYGGFNSHMSIRCSELSIPAIIGIGENNFKKVSNSKKIFFDCKNKNFKIL